MAYWAITVGINHYQHPHIQPLMYAQRDAQLLCDFLVKEAKFPAEQCLVLADASRASRGIYPNRDNIQTTITRICQQQLQPGDFLWCFFSGYGMRFDGQDYLVPVDGNPDEIATTGIPIKFLFSMFATAPTHKIFLVLDVNRSQTVLTGEGIGEQTAALAKEYNIPTLLACPPDQFSHETLALRQGLFTTALIEAMRYQGCTTPEAIIQYLGQRLPELSEHHWRPRQDPFAILPADKRYWLVMPEAAAITLSARRVEVAAPPSRLPAPSHSSSYSGYPSERNPLSFETVPADSPWNFAYPDRTAQHPHSRTATPTLETTSPDQPAHKPSPMLAPPFSQEVSLPSQPSPSMTPTIEPTDLSDALFWRRLLTWGSVIAAALLLGVMLRAGGSGEGNRSEAASFPASPSEPAPSITDEPIAQPSIQAAPGSTLESAYLAVRARNYSEAKQFLAEVPAEQQNRDYHQLLNEANKGLLSDAKVHLTKVRELTTENQAADFVDAINTARQIAPNEPQYREAQQYINRWSSIILDMAQGRADRRNDSSTSIAANNFNAAIRTAQMIPAEGSAYKPAQDAIAHWSQRLFDLAQARASEGMYDVAIQTVETIPPEAPIYEAVQAAIAEWRERPLLYQPPVP